MYTTPGNLPAGRQLLLSHTPQAFHNLGTVGLLYTLPRGLYPVKWKIYNLKALFLVEF